MRNAAKLICRLRGLGICLVVLAVSFLVSSSASAFNNDECGNLFPKIADKHQPYLSPFYLSTMFPSTTSYISSWGKCSMYGAILERKKFITASIGKLSVEAARGQGENVETLARLSGCPESHQDQFASELKDQFENVFADSVAGFELDQFTQKVDSMIVSSPVLRRNCQLITVNVSTAESR